MNNLKQIKKKFKEISKIDDPHKRIDKVIEHIKTGPLNTRDVPIFILNELKKLWDIK